MIISASLDRLTPIERRHELLDASLKIVKTDNDEDTIEMSEEKLEDVSHILHHSR